MDLTGMIFVLLAIGWAVYLLPMALKRHDDVDRTRPVEEFSDKLRVLGRGALPARTASPTSVPTTDSTPDVELVETPVLTRPTISREAARGAARRRRRVLVLLLTTLVALTVTSYLAYTPWLTTAIPGGLVVAFLVVARLTVRAQQVRRAAPVQRLAAPAVDVSAAEVEPDLGLEDTEGLSRAELDEALAQDLDQPVLDEGALWDPLPVTLPTYVTKPRARRTVRTIELTATSAGITSSGHDAADSALAADAAAAESAEADEVIEAPKAAGA